MGRITKGENIKIIGIERGERVSKKTGLPYAALVIYATYSKPTCDGACADTIFCKAEAAPRDLAVGDEIRPLYNRFGSVEVIERV